MNCHQLLFASAAILLAGALDAAQPAAAPALHQTPFTGVWHYNPARSVFHPGPAFKSFTLTFTPDGVRHLDLLPASGVRLQAALPWSDGSEVAVSATQGTLQGVTAVSKIQGRRVKDTWRENGRVIELVRGSVSSDGRTLTLTVEGPLPDSGRFRNRLVFEKQ